MHRTSICLFLGILAALLGPLWSLEAQIPIPSLKARVNDYASTLSPQDKEQLESKLTALEQKKGSQIAVLIIQSTEGEAIEAYGIRLAQIWKLGRKDVDDGAILIIAKNDRRMRIEVGYGLEGVLNDATCKRIISDIITPYFKQGDFPAGIRAGIDAMIKLVEGEPLPEVKVKEELNLGNIGNLIFWGFFGFLMLASILVSLIGRPAAAAVMTALVFFVLMLVGAHIILNIVLSIAAFLITLFASFEPASGGCARSSRHNHDGGGSDFSFGSGGFSGGGGSFGGGGASGSW